MVAKLLIPSSKTSNRGCTTQEPKYKSALDRRFLLVMIPQAGFMSEIRQKPAKGWRFMTL